MPITYVDALDLDTKDFSVGTLYQVGDIKIRTWNWQVATATSVAAQDRDAIILAGVAPAVVVLPVGSLRARVKVLWRNATTLNVILPASGQQIENDTFLDLDDCGNGGIELHWADGQWRIAGAY